MNTFFKDQKEFFDELVEVSFCGDNNYVQLVYIEKRKRSEEMLKDLTDDLNKRQQKNSTFKKH